MGASAPGALNAQGFSQAINSKQLPDYNHITHSGIFNQNFFQVGNRATRLLEIHHGLAISNCDLYDLPNRNYFLSLFVKSSTDGQKRTCPLNIVVCLDVSGSMGGPLKYQYQEGKPYPGPELSRLSLARKAILMLFNKLEKNDAFSLVTFHTQARTIIQSQFVSEMNKTKVEEKVNSNFQSGGTTISTGFNQAMRNINNFKSKHALKNYQHRIVMLTDVCDNSVAGEEKLIRQISDSGVSTTIIGVSTDFKSETCEKLIKVKGFNYLCAVENQDLQTYLVDQFDYTFFPCVQDTVIKVTSESIEEIEVFGSIDGDVKYPVQGKTFTVTKMQSGFPSALTLSKQGKVETKGGLILVKFKPKHLQGLPKMNLQIDVVYSDLQGKTYTQSYFIEKSIEAEEFYSDEAAKQGVYLFYYTETIRNLLKSMKEGSNVLTDSNKGFYLQKLDRLKEYCPKLKLNELQTLREIVQEK